jgi:hypothetical protein
VIDIKGTFYKIKYFFKGHSYLLLAVILRSKVISFPNLSGSKGVGPSFDKVTLTTAAWQATPVEPVRIQDEIAPFLPVSVVLPPKTAILEDFK